MEEKVAPLVVGSNKKPNLVFLENQGVVWLKDSVQAPGNTASLSEDDFENDAIRRAHIEKDFIAFCSSTPGNEDLHRTPLWALPKQLLRPTH